LRCCIYEWKCVARRQRVEQRPQGSYVTRVQLRGFQEAVRKAVRVVFSVSITGDSDI